MNYWIEQREPFELFGVCTEISNDSSEKEVILLRIL